MRLYSAKCSKSDVKYSWRYRTKSPSESLTTSYTLRGNGDDESSPMLENTSVLFSDRFVRRWLRRIAIEASKSTRAGGHRPRRCRLRRTPRARPAGPIARSAVSTTARRADPVPRRPAHPQRAFPEAQRDSRPRQPVGWPSSGRDGRPERGATADPSLWLEAQVPAPQRGGLLICRVRAAWVPESTFRRAFPPGRLP